MADLRILIAGQDSDTVATALTTVLADGMENVTIARQRPSELPEATRRAIDPVSIAALVLSIPGAVLAAIDLTDRLRKRKKAQAVVETARSLQDSHRVVISVIVGDGGLRAIGQLTADELLDIADRE